MPLTDSVNWESASGPYIHQATGLALLYKKHSDTKQ